MPGTLADEAGAAALALTCYTCHTQVHAAEGGIPSLQGLERAELIRRLQAFRRGEGDATIMDRIAAAYTDEEIAVIADYISARDGRP